MKDILNWTESLQRLRIQLQDMVTIGHLKDQEVTGGYIGERMGISRRTVNRYHQTYKLVKENVDEVKEDVELIMRLLDK